MKKYLMIGLCLAFTLMLINGCKKNNGTQIPNPVKQVESSEGFSDLGIKMDAPKDSENVNYSLINDEIAQINFTYNETDYTLRAAHNIGYSELMGVYDEYKEAETFTYGSEKDNQKEKTYDLYKTQSGYRIMIWNISDITFGVYTDQNVDDTIMCRLFEELNELIQVTK